MIKQRHWWAALLFGLWCPGLGHFYAGLTRRSFVVLALYISLAFGGLLGLPLFPVPALFMWVLSWILLPIASAIDAAVWARRLGEVRLNKYQRWYIYVLIGFGLISFTSGASFLIKRYAVEAFKVPSSTMSPTIIDGDHILVKKGVLSHEKPNRGDIVVFNLPNNSTNIVKRVVAIGGDVVELRGKELRLNGKVTTENYAQYASGGNRDLPMVTVPSGKVIVLGDNRDFSKDSRYYEVPFVDESWIRGRAFIIYWSPGHRERIGLKLED